jgi:hypothetical protein
MNFVFNDSRQFGRLSGRSPAMADDCHDRTGRGHQFPVNFEYQGGILSYIWI